MRHAQPCLHPFPWLYRIADPTPYVIPRIDFIQVFYLQWQDLKLRRGMAYDIVPRRYDVLATLLPCLYGSWSPTLKIR